MSENLIDNGELKIKNDLSEWKEYKLEDIATKIGSGATPRGGSNSYKTEGISLIRSQNILDLKFSTNGLAFIGDTQANALKNVIVELNDVLLNITGDSVARVCKVPNYILPARVNQHVAIIRADVEKLIPDFLLYNLIAQKKELLSQSEIGATRRAITKGMIEKFRINLPSLSEQRAIASVLSSLDDKIDLLHRQNLTLEKMAETLFRQWFIEDAKEDWDKITIGEIINIGSGKGLKKDKFVNNGDYPILGANGEIGRTNEFLCNEKLIYTGRVGTLGKVFRIENKKVWLSDNTLIIRPIKYYNFIYFILKNANLKQYNVGSTQPLIRQSDIKKIEILITNEDKHFAFEELSESYFNKIDENKEQILTLEKMRDTLLPKLMSGEVRVKDII